MNTPLKKWSISSTPFTWTQYEQKVASSKFTEHYGKNKKWSCLIVFLPFFSFNLMPVICELLQDNT